MNDGYYVWFTIYGYDHAPMYSQYEINIPDVAVVAMIEVIALVIDTAGVGVTSVIATEVETKTAEVTVLVTTAWYKNNSFNTSVAI